MKMFQLSLKAVTIVLILQCCRFGTSLPTIDDEVRQLIIDHAPVIWLHPEELFYPSTLEFHYENTEVRDENETVIQENPTRSTIITGDETANMHLNSVPELACPDCLQPWFAGQNLSEVPVYVYIRQYNDSCGTLDVAYKASFPYNYGKDVCIGVVLAGECVPADAIQSFGNHVGDFEGLSLRFLNGVVSSAYVSAHHFGAAYQWNETANNFYFVYGEEFFDFLNGTYPEFIDMFEDNHAEIFTANGSHGMWSAEGSHEYMNLPVKLVDETGRGEAWRTWELMELIPYEDGYIYDGNYTYVEYQGRYGNLKKGCGVAETVSGECILVDGPRHYRSFPSDNFPTACLIP